MTKPVEKIVIGGREYSRFIRYPKQARDGTVRCMSCGQIDEPEYHDSNICQSERAKALDAHLAYLSALKAGDPA